MKHQISVEYSTFPAREERVRYVVGRFQKYLASPVLDVGCDKAYMRAMCPDADYTGIDLAPEADLRLNLEQTERLPFEDNSFQCVFCIDVLEHLDNLHSMFQELVRVSKGFVVISWHNCWVNARLPLYRGHGNISHYGLPLERPVDRHKWFFNLTQSLEFIQAHEKDGQFRIKELFAGEKPRPALLRKVRRVRYPRQTDYLNRYAHTLWTVLEKKL